MIYVAGAGAFGTAMAVTQATAERPVTLMARDSRPMQKSRESPRLPGVTLPDTIRVTDLLETEPDDILLLCVPMQTLSDFLERHQPKASLVACCKGIDLKTGHGPTKIMASHANGPTAILTGPSFASDIASGLPTALTLASSDVSFGETLQHALSTDALRLYLSDDPRGAELGGALKNVIAIACGICMGAKLGESARAALMTRGFAEMQRIAVALGASTETLAGLAGFGDLALTCTSSQSRNFSFGYALGAGTTQPDATTEGRATSRAVVKLAAQHGVDMPIANAVAGMVEGRTSLEDALDALLSRPLGKE